MPVSDETIERLEMQIAYLERANNELSDVVYQQQRELETLRAQLASLERRFEDSKPEPTPLSAELERPPHY